MLFSLLISLYFKKISHFQIFCKFQTSKISSHKQIERCDMSNPSAASDEPQHSTITTNKVANKENKVKHLFDQIESIKKTICMANGDRPELWIQRQNLQDLYHQVILKLVIDLLVISFDLKH